MFTSRRFFNKLKFYPLLHLLRFIKFPRQVNKFENCSCYVYISIEIYFNKQSDISKHLKELFNDAITLFYLSFIFKKNQFLKNDNEQKVSLLSNPI